MRRLILASGSPARRSLLESAGLRPEVMISDVAEDGVEHLAPTDAVAELARRKGRAVAARTGPDAALVVACDSMLEFDGEVWGKAESEAEVVRRWTKLRGGRGLLHTGHFVMDSGDGAVAEETDTAVVHFGTPDDHEIEAYSRTLESRRVAGPFTLEGRSGPWIDGIEGNCGTILGLSLPVLRRLLARVGVDIIDLWH